MTYGSISCFPLVFLLLCYRHCQGGHGCGKGMRGVGRGGHGCGSQRTAGAVPPRRLAHGDRPHFGPWRLLCRTSNAPLFSFVHLANFSGAFTVCQDAEMSDGRQGLLHRCAFVRKQTKRYLHPETGCLQLAGAFYFAKSFPKGGFQIVSSQTFF